MITTGSARRSIQQYEYGVSTFIATIARSVGSASRRECDQVFSGPLCSGDAGSSACSTRILYMSTVA